VTNACKEILEVMQQEAATSNRGFANHILCDKRVIVLQSF